MIQFIKRLIFGKRDKLIATLYATAGKDVKLDTEQLWFVYQNNMPLWGPFKKETEAFLYFDKITQPGNYSIVKIVYRTVEKKRL